MRVLHVVPSLNPELGGPTEVALQLCHSLLDIGVDVEIATTNDCGASTLDVPLGQRVKYHEIPSWFFKRSIVRRKEFIPSWGLYRWLQKNITSYDIVQTEYLFCFSTTCSATIARRARVPYIMRTTGQLTPWALSQGALRKRLYSWCFERSLLNNAAAVYCTSPGEVADVRAYGVSTVIEDISLGVSAGKPIHNARQRLREQLGISEHTQVLVYLSRLHHKKRPEWVIEAVATCVKAGLSVCAVIAGSGEANYAQSLRELARARGVEGYVYFPDFLQGEEKEVLLQGGDLFLLPSQSENFGIAVAEALAAGLVAVITPGVQISEEICPAGAAVCADDDKSAYNESVLQLLIDADRRALISKTAREFARERYSWKSCALRIAESYERILVERDTHNKGRDAAENITS